MTVIVLLVFGVLLLVFVLMFRKKHTIGFKRIMKGNRNVPPLLKVRSTQIKYQTLHAAFKHKPAAMQKLEQLHSSFDDKLISLDAYHDALDELAETEQVN